METVQKHIIENIFQECWMKEERRKKEKKHVIQYWIAIRKEIYANLKTLYALQFLIP